MKKQRLPVAGWLAASRSMNSGVPSQFWSVVTRSHCAEDE